MKKYLIIAALLFAGASSFASTSEEWGTEAADASNGYWHCTAYPQGHGHTWGYSYKDIHYQHAYYGAMQRCEAMTHHHCHHVDCHYDVH